MGWMRFSSRSNRVPKIRVNNRFTLSPLAIQPVPLDICAHGIGHEISNGTAVFDALADLRGGQVERWHRNDLGDQWVPHNAGTRSGKDDDIGKFWKRFDFPPLREVASGVRP